MGEEMMSEIYAFDTTNHTIDEDDEKYHKIKPLTSTKPRIDGLALAAVDANVSSWTMINFMMMWWRRWGMCYVNLMFCYFMSL